MKYALIIGMSLASTTFAAEQLTFGLDRKADAVRRKSPVVIYLGNDVMAPTSLQEVSRLAGYLHQRSPRDAMTIAQCFSTGWAGDRISSPAGMAEGAPKHRT